MKKLFSVLSILIIASLTLMACGSQSPATQSPVTATPQAVETTVKETGDGRIQIRWFVGLGTGAQPEQLPAQQKAVDDFNTSQDKIELTLEIVPYESAKDTLATQIASGAGPDIIGPVGWSGSNAFYGQWLDLTPYIKSTGFDTSIYDPALIQFYQTEEGQVGLPFLVFPAAIYYVPAMFDKAGLEYPPSKYGDKYTLDGQQVDWNWDTLAAVAKRLTLDATGKNAKTAGFDRTQIVQVGFVPNNQLHLAYLGSYLA